METEWLLDLPGEGGDHFHCMAEPLPSLKIPLTCYRLLSGLRPGKKWPKNGISPHPGSGGKKAGKWENRPKNGSKMGSSGHVSIFRPFFRSVAR